MPQPDERTAASPSRWRQIRAANPQVSKRNAKLFAYPRRISASSFVNHAALYHRLHRKKVASRV